MGNNEVLVTQLRKILLEGPQRRDSSDVTIPKSLRVVEDFALHFGKSPHKLGLEHLRTYQAYQLKHRRVVVGSVVDRLPGGRLDLIPQLGFWRQQVARAAYSFQSLHDGVRIAAYPGVAR